MGLIYTIRSRVVNGPNVVNIVTEKLRATQLCNFSSVYLFNETAQRVRLTLKWL